MNKSRSFDRAAGYYDQTRQLPQPVATQGMQAIMDLAGPGARILEVGAGTGRISIPLLERGLDLVGCDLSSKMLARLHEKLPSARIVQADGTQLPFPSAAFDVVMTVHVLHLVPSWREALREFFRLLRPGGTYLNVKTWATAGVSIRDQVRQHWRDWLAARGVDASLPGVQGDEDLARELRSLGADLAEVEVVRYPITFTLGEQLERLGARVCSDAWEVPDALFEASLQDLRAWVEHEYGSLDETREDEQRFTMQIARLPRASNPG